MMKWHGVWGGLALVALAGCGAKSDVTGNGNPNKVPPPVQSEKLYGISTDGKRWFGFDAKPIDLHGVPAGVMAPMLTGGANPTGGTPPAAPAGDMVRYFLFEVDHANPLHSPLTVLEGGAPFKFLVTSSDTSSDPKKAWFLYEVAMPKMDVLKFMKFSIADTAGTKVGTISVPLKGPTKLVTQASNEPHAPAPGETLVEVNPVALGPGQFPAVSVETKDGKETEASEGSLVSPKLGYEFFVETKLANLKSVTVSSRKADDQTFSRVPMWPLAKLEQITADSIKKKK